MNDPVGLILYLREGCHLCEDLEAQLAELLEPDAYSLQRIDIDTDPALHRRYNERVPVLAHGEHEICHHFLDLIAVKQLLASQYSHR